MCCKWELCFFFRPPPLRQEVICSVQQAFCWEGFLRSVSHALALSRQAGSRIFALPSQHPCSSISKDLFLCSFSFFVLDFCFEGRFFFHSFIIYFLEAAAQQQQQHRWKPNNLHHNTGSLFTDLSSLHPLPLPRWCLSRGLWLYVSLWRIASQLWIPLKTD